MESPAAQEHPGSMTPPPEEGKTLPRQANGSLDRSSSGSKRRGSRKFSGRFTLPKIFAETFLTYVSKTRKGDDPLAAKGEGSLGKGDGKKRKKSKQSRASLPGSAGPEEEQPERSDELEPAEMGSDCSALWGGVQPPPPAGQRTVISVSYSPNGPSGETGPKRAPPCPRPARIKCKAPNPFGAEVGGPAPCPVQKTVILVGGAAPGLPYEEVAAPESPLPGCVLLSGRAGPWSLRPPPSRSASLPSEAHREDDDSDAPAGRRRRRQSLPPGSVPTLGVSEAVEESLSESGGVGPPSPEDGSREGDRAAAALPVGWQVVDVSGDGACVGSGGAATTVITVGFPPEMWAPPTTPAGPFPEAALSPEELPLRSILQRGEQQRSAEDEEEEERRGDDRPEARGLSEEDEVRAAEMPAGTGGCESPAVSSDTPGDYDDHSAADAEADKSESSEDHGGRDWRTGGNATAAAGHVDPEGEPRGRFAGSGASPSAEGSPTASGQRFTLVKSRSSDDVHAEFRAMFVYERSQQLEQKLPDRSLLLQRILCDARAAAPGGQDADCADDDPASVGNPHRKKRKAKFRCGGAEETPWCKPGKDCPETEHPEPDSTSGISSEDSISEEEKERSYSVKDGCTLVARDCRFGEVAAKEWPMAPRTAPLPAADSELAGWAGEQFQVPASPDPAGRAAREEGEEAKPEWVIHSEEHSRRRSTIDWSSLEKKGRQPLSAGNAKGPCGRVDVSAPFTPREPYAETVQEPGEGVAAACGDGAIGEPPRPCGPASGVSCPAGAKAGGEGRSPPKVPPTQFQKAKATSLLSSRIPVPPGTRHPPLGPQVAKQGLGGTPSPPPLSRGGPRPSSGVQTKAGGCGRSTAAGNASQLSRVKATSLSNLRNLDCGAAGSHQQTVRGASTAALPEKRNPAPSRKGAVPDRRSAPWDGRAARVAASPGRQSAASPLAARGPAASKAPVQKMARSPGGLSKSASLTNIRVMSRPNPSGAAYDGRAAGQAALARRNAGPCSEESPPGIPQLRGRRDAALKYHFREKMGTIVV